MKQTAKPFVKWAGGKSQILADIRAKFPNELGIEIKKYAEPFVGGGAVLFDILNNYSLKHVYISDINRELIHTYTTICDNVDELIASLFVLEMLYLPSDTEQRKRIYYSKRDRFNELKLLNDSSVELAALFIFINRTCFNGLYRVNSRGEYNVPQGSYKKQLSVIRKIYRQFLINSNVLLSHAPTIKTPPGLSTVIHLRILTRRIVLSLPQPVSQLMRKTDSVIMSKRNLHVLLSRYVNAARTSSQAIVIPKTPMTTMIFSMSFIPNSAFNVFTRAAP